MGYSFVDVHTLEGEGPGGVLRQSRSRLDPSSGGRRDGLEFVTFGAPLDGTYEPPSWG